MLAASRRYHEQLEQASSTRLIQDFEDVHDKAKQTLAFLNVLVKVGEEENDPMVFHDVIPEFFWVLTTWTHFRTNAADLAARKAEEALIISIAQLPIIQSEAEWYVKSAGTDHFYGGERDKMLLAKRWKDSFSETLEKKAYDAMSAPEGISAIIPHGAREALKRFLCCKGSPLWDKKSPYDLRKILKQAKDTSHIQQNAFNLMYLWKKSITEGYADCEREDVRELIAEEDVMSAVWKAAIAQEIQFRFLSETRDLRKFLLASGATPKSMPQPKWLTRVKNV